MIQTRDPKPPSASGLGEQHMHLGLEHGTGDREAQKRSEQSPLLDETQQGGSRKHQVRPPKRELSALSKPRAGLFFRFFRGNAPRFASPCCTRDRPWG